MQRHECENCWKQWICEHNSLRHICKDCGISSVCAEHDERPVHSQQETEDSSEDEQHGDSADGEEEIEVGTRVEVLFGDGTWYPGTVASVPCDQWASVRFDDGDRYTVQFPDPAIRLLSAGQTALPHAGGASSRRWASAASEGGKTVLDGLWCEVCSRSFGSAQVGSARSSHQRALPSLWLTCSRLLLPGAAHARQTRRRAQAQPAGQTACMSARANFNLFCFVLFCGDACC
eukprot:3826407-Rhodomonas_salina.1